MRLRHPAGRTIHLNYGMNVQAASNLDDLVAQLDTYATAVRARLGLQTLAVSPWLPPQIAADLAVDSRSRLRLRAELDARGLEVVTLSGDPYVITSGDAPGPARYTPDWSTVERLEYTLDLARILVDLLPDDAVRGSVCTIGVGRREGWDSSHERDAARILGRLSGGLAEIAWQTGRAVRVGLQPEAGAVMDTVEQSVAALARVDRDRVGVCLDLANLACAWQEPVAALDRLAAGGVSVIKVQVASALEVADPVAAADLLRGFVEPHHLHQVTTPTAGYADDLSVALSEGLPGPWRVRYRVPLHTAPAAPLASTTAVWHAALRHLLAGDVPGCDHLDVRAATVDARPTGEHDPSRTDGVAADLAHVRDELAALGLSPPQTCATR